MLRRLRIAFVPQPGQASGLAAIVAVDILAARRLAHLADRRPEEVSLGEQQRTALGADAGTGALVAGNDPAVVVAADRVVRWSDGAVDDGGTSETT